MKLIIQIPCFNEEDSLPITIKELPQSIEGIDTLEYLIIDDGSTDNTVKVARDCGVHHIVSHNRNRGLSKAFTTGLRACLERGADIIVNTDADNQYCAADIVKLVRPIMEKRADIVIGSRLIDKIESFSRVKKFLEKAGSYFVRILSGIRVSDAPSGFRALSRDAAFQINVFNKYTYTLETIIQAGQKDLLILDVPVGVNEKLRSSRLVKSIPRYIYRSVLTILRIFIIYRPLRFFGAISFLFLLIGAALGFRYLYFYIIGEGAGHIQSLIFMLVLLFAGFILLVMGIVGDSISVNRKILEDIQYDIRRSVSGRDLKE